MGSDVDKDPTSRDYERPQHSVELTEYYVARYPVTVAQFRVFAADNRLEVHEPLCLRGVPNHPVTFVSFDEALAYCEWLTDRLRSAEWTPSVLRKQLASGWAITLPSEAQWEKAARGLDGRIYPWGNDGSEAVDRFAFSADAVGTFPDEASPCGALDLLSRTEVWTCSLWGQNPDVPDYTYPYDPNDAERHDVHAPLDVLRVVRGGRQMKFLPDPHLRGVARRGAGISDDVGFRLILSGPPLVA
jgi:formylglycine-generating enzyme required for sulfatase activity